MLSQANVNANAKSEAATMSSLWRFLYCNVCTQAYKDLNIHTQTHVCTYRHTHTAVLQRSGDKSRYWNPSSLTAINYSVCVRVCVWQLVRQLCACVCRAALIRFLSPLDYEFLGKRGDVPYQSSGWAIKHGRAHTDVEPRYVAADRERCVCLRVCVLHCQRSWNEAQTVHQTTLTFSNSFTFFNLLWVKVKS